MRKVEGLQSYTLESLRYPGCYLSTSDMGRLTDQTHGHLKLVTEPDDELHKTWFALTAVRGTDGKTRQDLKVSPRWPHVYTVKSVRYSSIVPGEPGSADRPVGRPVTKRSSLVSLKKVTPMF